MAPSSTAAGDDAQFRYANHRPNEAVLHGGFVGRYDASPIHQCPLCARGLNRSRGRTPRLAATRQSNRRRLIVTSGAINPLLAMIR
jgi:hypothetical protein